MFVIRAISVLPEAVRPGVSLVLAGLVLWLVLVRRGWGDVWDAACRGVARGADFCLGAVLWVEYKITAGRRKRELAPYRWAFGLSRATDPLEGLIARTYRAHEKPAGLPVAAKSVPSAPSSGAAAQKPGKTRARPPRPSVPWRLCLLVLVGVTAAWVTMGQLSPASQARYRISQGFDPWRDVEEWAEVDSDRHPKPVVLRSRRHHALLNVRLACNAEGGCTGWVLLESKARGLVAVRYVAAKPGSVLLQIRLTPEQESHAADARLAVVSV